MRAIASILAVLWALPWTLFGLVVGGLGLLTGAKASRQGRVIEFYGGGAAWFLRTFPLISGASAVTFGHVVLARDRPALESARRHELVHVTQYERWGPFFVPAYVICWLVLWLRRRHPYWDNPFEREAYQKSGPGD